MFWTIPFFSDRFHWDIRKTWALRRRTVCRNCARMLISSVISALKWKRWWESDPQLKKQPVNNQTSGCTERQDGRVWAPKFVTWQKVCWGKKAKSEPLCRTVSSTAHEHAGISIMRSFLTAGTGEMVRSWRKERIQPNTASVQDSERQPTYSDTIHTLEHSKCPETETEATVLAGYHYH